MLRLIQSPTTGPQHAPAVWGLMGGPVLLRRRRRRLTQHALLVSFLPLLSASVNSSTGFDIWWQIRGLLFDSAPMSPS